MLGLALAGCGGGLFDGTPYTGDVQPTVPKAETAEVAPLGPAEQPPVPSVGGPLGTAQAGGPAKTYSIPSLEATDADRAAMQQARAQQQQAMQGQRQAQLNAQRQAAFQAQQQAQQQAAAQPQQQPTGTVAPLSFGQRRNTAAPAAMEAMPRPASPQTYPNLATVPQKPGDLPTPEEQAVVRNQLEADRAASGAPGALSFGNRAGGQAAAAPAAPAAAEPKPAFSFANRVVGTVKFDGGSTTMPAAGNSTVEQVAKTAQSPKLRVVGYGAGDGAGQAKARAEAVAAALRAAGVDPARIVTGGSADTRANITDDQAARVEIYLAQ
jgi:outer membrane protein OmpA-like peptidoglycan-associated protein